MVCASIAIAYFEMAINQRKNKLARMNKEMEDEKDALCKKLNISRGQLKALCDAYDTDLDEFSALCRSIEKSSRKPRPRRANKHLKK